MPCQYTSQQELPIGLRCGFPSWRERDLRPATSPRTAASLAAAALVGLLTISTGPISGVSDSPGRDSADGPSGLASVSASIPGARERDGTSVRIELVASDEIAIATLDDTPEARAFAAMLPITVDMEDPFGQAKTGRLPRALPLDAPERSRSYAAGDLAYWSPSGRIAVVYDALVGPCLRRVWFASAPCRPDWRPSPPQATTSR
jgi:hypothetical protein